MISSQWSQSMFRGTCLPNCGSMPILIRSINSGKQTDYNWSKYKLDWFMSKYMNALKTPLTTYEKKTNYEITTAPSFWMLTIWYNWCLIFAFGAMLKYSSTNFESHLLNFYGNMFTNFLLTNCYYIISRLVLVL